MNYAHLHGKHQKAKSLHSWLRKDYFTDVCSLSKKKKPPISFFHVRHKQIIIGLKLQNPFLPLRKSMVSLTRLN